MPLFSLSESDVEKMEAKRDINGLIKALSYKKDTLVRRMAASALWKIGDVRALDGLIAALKDQNAQVRSVAAGALGKIGDERAVDGLVAALEDPSMFVRAYAADALGEIGGERAVDGLAVALKDQDAAVRQRAANALSKIVDAHAVDASKDPNGKVRTAATEALVKINAARKARALLGIGAAADARLQGLVQQIASREPICDICGSHGTGTPLSSEDMRKAVFKKGFDPFSLGLVASFQPANVAFEGWKNTIVAQDTSDWNICARCMSTLGTYLEGEPKPTGVMESKVSTSPLLGAMAAKKAEEKYKRESPISADTLPGATTAKVEGPVASIDEVPQGQVVCGGCGKAMPSSLEYCSNCGKDLEGKVTTQESTPPKVNRSDEGQVLCSGCGKAMPSSLEYCSNCGKKLNGKAAPEANIPRNVSCSDEGRVNCGGCGKAMPSSLEYCSNCGKKLIKAPPEESNRIVGSPRSHAVEEIAEKEKSEKEVHGDKNIGKSPERGTDTSAGTGIVGNSKEEVNQKITCASCRKDFTWNEAYQQQDTRGSFLYNPPGHGNFRPRAFCPNCGFLVAEWDIDRYEDRNRWKWYGENAQANQGRELPPSPLEMWGQDIMSDAQVAVREDRIYIKLLRPLPIVHAHKDTKGVETKAERLSPQQILADANKELDNSFRSRSKFFDSAKAAFEALRSYVELEGKSDAKAIALLGLIEYYGGKRDAAREMFNRSLSLDESCALSHLGLGILDYIDANFGVSHPNAAKSGLKRLSDAITLDPSLVDAYVWKARIQKQNLKDAQGAWNTLQEAISTLGEDTIREDARGSYLFSKLGQLCIFDYKGNLDDALRYFEMALAINPNQYEAPMHLMYIYLALGRSADAARAQLAYERADQGINLTNEAIDAIRRFIAHARGSFIGQKYEVQRELGHGGFGRVYLVYSHETKEVYAMKTFRDEYLADSARAAETRELFRKEANVWIELERHPYLVRAYFVDEVSGRLYIGMEYIAPNEMGLNSLDAYLKRQPPDLAQSLRWAIQFCYGMEYANSKGVRCHRDIKPENIMISTDKTVTITDFGLAGVLGSNMENKGLGTPTHMPPEQFINAKACDVRSDIYAFGIVLYQMTTRGELPFPIPWPRDNSSEEQVRFWNDMHRLHDQAQVPQLSSPLSSVIQRCLEKRPERRYQTFEELRADLEPLLKRQTGEEIRLPTSTEFGAWEWNNKGTSLEKVGLFNEAIKCYDKALEINQHNAETWFNKGNALSSLGRFDEAIKCHDKALEVNPRHPMGWSNKGVSLHELGRFDEAIKCYDKAIEINPRNTDAWNNKGASLGSLGRFDEAIKCQDKALEIDPRHANAWVNKGASLRGLGRFDDAIECYDKALKINPEHAGAWNNRGIGFLKLGRFDEAVNCYDRALEINPKQADAWFNKANCFLKSGRFAEAVECYGKALEINPQHPGALINKGIAEGQLGRRGDAAQSGHFDEAHAEKDAETGVLELERRMDFRALAALFNSTDYRSDPLHYKKKRHAKIALKRAGSKAVEAILEETAKDGLGQIDLAELLANMNDTRAVPLLKKMLDRGCFDAYSSKFTIEEFVKKYPELHGTVETGECALCGKKRPTTEMRRASSGFGAPLKYLCSDTCWNKRGRIVGSSFYGAKNCPYYSDGMCTAGGDNTCSLSFGSYNTTCYVYRDIRR